ncbi:female sterile (1) Young arrest isoform X1 [Choristoneura fumiferana]|uniref:female sterile (1) Young arrest isoform X1 n=1 Tax=Choristoneura fumiferana TaxID=7141 RepID=UPI003D15D94B
MKSPPEVTCIVCQLVFCCGSCRWRHEQRAHGLPFDCALCRGRRFLCRPQLLQPAFLHHLKQEHLPLRCHKCQKTFATMEDFDDIDQCVSLSELVDQSKISLKIVDERFDSLYEKIINSNEDLEAVVSFNKSNKTAVITPIIRKKYLVDYEASDTENEDGDCGSPKVSVSEVAPKTPRAHRATPHVKKLVQMARQLPLDDDRAGSPDLSKTEPADEGPSSSMRTPTSHVPALLALAALTTSTPTQAAPGAAHPPAWPLFAAQADSPLSEIENGDSPAMTFDTGTEETEQSHKQAPKLKSIMASRRGDSGDSTEQDARAKRVQFAHDTVFQPEEKIKRVFRKPKRMLTPGPQKARFCCNPRFQALINRFEQNTSIQPGSTPASAQYPADAEVNAQYPGSDTLARTPVNRMQETPPVGEHSNIPRAINFKDSPVLEDKDNELFKSCVATPGGMDTAITALSTNIAGSLQTCITNVLKHTEEETEIQFKFTITKKKVCVKKMADDVAPVGERDRDKENLWATVKKAVKSAFWGDGEDFETPHKSIESSSNSSAKRKRLPTSGSPSPLSHKRHKFEPRLRGRPPLRSAPLPARLARHDVTSHSF